MMAANPLASKGALSARDLYGATAAMMGPDHIDIAERLDASILGFDPGFRYTYRSVSSPEGMMRLDLGDALALVSLDSVSPYLAGRPDIVLRETVDGRPIVEQRCSYGTRRMRAAEAIGKVRETPSYPQRNARLLRLRPTPLARRWGQSHRPAQNQAARK